MTSIDPMAYPPQRLIERKDELPMLPSYHVEEVSDQTQERPESELSD